MRGWFLTLDKGFGPTLTIRDAVKKVFFDQIVFAPILTAILLSVFGFSQGMDKHQAREKLRKVHLTILGKGGHFQEPSLLSQEYVNLLLGFYKLWPCAQLINFYFVPLNLRVSYTNMVSIVWNSYVGYVANRPMNKKTAELERTNS